jgi:hypothetical protein
VGLHIVLHGMVFVGLALLHLGGRHWRIVDDVSRVSLVTSIDAVAIFCHYLALWILTRYCCSGRAQGREPWWGQGETALQLHCNMS